MTDRDHGWRPVTVEHDSPEYHGRVDQRDLLERPLTDEERQESAAYYAAFYASRAEGPQLEGLPEEAVEAALQDPQTVAVELSTPQGHIVWPLLVPVAYNEEYRKDFFEEHVGPHTSERALYFSDPGEILDGTDCHLEGFADESTPIVYEYQEGGSMEGAGARLRHMLGQSNVDVQDYFVHTPEAEHPRVIHFATRTEVLMGRDGPVRQDLQAVFDEMVEAGEAARNPENGATILRPQDVADNRGGLADSIWAMYRKQFDDLIEEHPSMQEQPRENLIGMLADSQTLSAAYYENKKIVGLMFFVRDIEKCEWLDSEYYRRLFPGEDLAYFPGIVIDEAAEGRALSLGLIRQVSDVLARANLPLRIVFQCTQESAQYVPRIVKLGVNRTDGLRAGEVEQLASYRYEVLNAQAQVVRSHEGAVSDDVALPPAA